MGKLEDFKEELSLKDRVHRDINSGDLVRFYRKSGGERGIDEILGIIPEKYEENQEGCEITTLTNQKYFLKYEEWLDFVVVERDYKNPQNL